jgi:hypothetical protein
LVLINSFARETSQKQTGPVEKVRIAFFVWQSIDGYESVAGNAGVVLVE